MSTQKAEAAALARIRKLAPRTTPEAVGGRDSSYDGALEDLVKSSDPQPKPQVGVIDEAVSLAIGGGIVRPYSEARDLHMGHGDVSNWGQPTETPSEAELQAQADRALVAKNAEHAEKRGPRKAYQP